MKRNRFEFSFNYNNSIVRQLANSIATRVSCNKTQRIPRLINFFHSLIITKLFYQSVEN